MENINRLLEKYFQATTTLAEEKVLRTYFESNAVLPEHKQFVSLFTAFNVEKEEVIPFEFKVQLPKRSRANKYIIQALISSGIAACLLIGFCAIQPKTEVENYAIVNGQMNADAEFAQKYVEEKLNEVNNVVTKNMKPIRTLHIVKKRLQPMQNLKVENTKSVKPDATTITPNTTVK